MKSVRRNKSAGKRVSRKTRKNARPNASLVVIPEGGVEALTARVGDPFPPMEFRELVLQARQKDPDQPDQAFCDMVRQTTESQIKTLIERMGLDPNDPDVNRQAFVNLATALFGVGQVVWTPVRYRRGWTEYQLQSLYWLVKSLCEQENLSERAAIRRIATDDVLGAFFPYRAQSLHREAKLSDEERRIGTFWQAWTKAKSKADQFVIDGPSHLSDAIGRSLSSWEAELVALDAGQALPAAGKKRAQ